MGSSSASAVVTRSPPRSGALTARSSGGGWTSCTRRTWPRPALRESYVAPMRTVRLLIVSLPALSTDLICSS
jgi:hypothetical protein